MEHEHEEEEGAVGPVALTNHNLVYLIGPMTDDLVADVTLGLEACEGDHIRLLINTPGGSLFSGIALGQAVRSLQRRGKEVVGEVQGRCFSSGAIPLLECGTRKMWRGAYLGIHGFSDHGEGPMDRLRNEQTFNDGLYADLVELFTNRTKVRQGYWEPVLYSDLMKYFSAEAAKRVGLIDEVL